MSVSVSPHRIEVYAKIENIEVLYFDTPILGRQPIPDREYDLVDRPKDISTSSIASIQEFYLTNIPDQYIVPIFSFPPKSRSSDQNRYYALEAPRVFRYDLIAYQFLSTVDYFWIILFANNILDPFNVELNTIFKIPSQETVLTRWLLKDLTLED